MLNTLLLVLAFVGQTSPALNETNRSWREHWREGGFDAITSLYVFYQQLGIPIAYENLAENIHLIDRPTFADVVQNAKENGAEVSLIKCTLADLGRIPLPAIIHLDSERESSVGEFVVLIAKTGDKWTTVNGSQGAFGTISQDTLLRQWSGLVLFARANTEWSQICRLGVLGLLCGVGIRSTRVRLSFDRGGRT